MRHIFIIEIKCNFLKLIFRKLLSQLERFKAQTSELPESEGSGETGITFQLKYRPEHTHMGQTNRLAELERRIHRLEVILGATNEKLSRLSTITSKGFDILHFYVTFL